MNQSTSPPDSHDLSCRMERNFINGFKLIAGINESQFISSPLFAEFFSGYGTAWLNCVFRADGGDAAIARTMKGVLKKYHSECPMIWHVGALTRSPETIRALLLANGATVAGTTPGMIRVNQELSPSNPIDHFAIREVQTADAITEWLYPFSQSFELEENIANHFDTFIRNRLAISTTDHWFVGYKNGLPVTSAYYLNDSDVSMIYNVSTCDAHRSHGYGRRIMEHVIDHATKKFADPIGLYSSEMGYALYEKLGFKQIYAIEEFSYPA